jgi:hypothetical protein
MEHKYAKGTKPQDLDAAKGGLVLDRTRNWQKDPDPDFHPMGTGLNGPFNTQEYTKGDRPDKEAVRKGDNKSLPTKGLMPKC